MTKIYERTFENGELLAGESLNGADISISTAAALGGGSENQWGLKVIIDDTAADYLISDDWPDQTEVRGRMEFQLSADFAMANSDLWYPFYFSKPSLSTALSYIKFNSAWSGPRLGVMGRLDSGGVGQADGSTNLSLNTKYRIEMHAQAATGAGQNDGFVKLYLNGSLEAEVTGLDNDTIIFDRFYAGCISPDAGTSGTVYLDNITVTDSAEEIGDYVGPAVPTAGLFRMEEIQDGAPACTIISTHDYGSGAGWRMCLEHESCALRAFYIGTSPKTYTTNLIPVSASTALRNLIPFNVKESSNWRWLTEGNAASVVSVLDLPAVQRVTLSNVYGNVSGLEGELTLTLYPSGKMCWKLTDTIIGKTVQDAQNYVSANNAQFGGALQEHSAHYYGLTDANANGQDLRACLYRELRYGAATASGSTVSGDSRHSYLARGTSSDGDGSYTEQALLTFLTDSDGSAARSDYRNPDPLDGSPNAGEVTVGSLVTDDAGDEDGDGFNESTGWYTLAASPNQVEFSLDPRRGGEASIPFRQLAFKVKNWLASVPEVIWLEGSEKYLDTDYHASVQENVLYLELLQDIDERSLVRIGGPPGHVEMSDHTRYLAGSDRTRWLGAEDQA